MPITICSWNVNSVNSRLEHLIKVLRENAPDVVLLQELKCLEEKFPAEQISECGYNFAVRGQKTYNGVAILSKHPIEDVCKNLPGDEESEQARYIEAVTTINGCVIRVASVYVPNGQEVGSEKFAYKMKFFSHLFDHLKKTNANEEIFVVGGDFNVAPENIDVYDAKSLEGSVGFHIDERTWFRKILSTNFYDAFRLKNPDSKEFSWWDYRSGSWQYDKGMRIDNLIISPEAVDLLEDAWVDKAPRAWDRPSDHTTIYIKLRSKWN
jgi:exodeoxyribonuclease-3